MIIYLSKYITVKTKINRQPGEIQSANFGYTKFSMFTACSYFINGSEQNKESIIVTEASDTPVLLHFAALKQS